MIDILELPIRTSHDQPTRPALEYDYDSHTSHLSQFRADVDHILRYAKLCQDKI
jgi:hypothetical protein